MLNLPTEITLFLALFAPLFTPSVWYHAQILLIGAILAPGKRTVTAILSVIGLRQHRHFQNYHRVLNRARWSSRAISHQLLLILVQVFVPQGPIFRGSMTPSSAAGGRRSALKEFIAIRSAPAIAILSKSVGCGG